MPKFLLKAFLFIAILVLVILAIQFSRRRELSTAEILLNPGNCSQPCWWNIQPGVTTFERSSALLQADKSVVFISPPEVYAGCWRMGPNKSWTGCIRGDTLRSTTQLFAVHLWPPPDTLRLGEVISILGEPTYAESCLFLEGLDRSVTNLPAPYWGLH